MITRGNLVENILGKAGHLASRAVRLVPTSPLWPALSAERHRIADEVWRDRKKEIQKVQRQYLSARKTRGKREAASSREVAERDLSNLAEDVLKEMRRRVVREVSSPLARLAAELDSRLPTDEAEYMDRADVDPQARLATVREVDRWSRNFGSYLLFAELLGPLLGRRPTTVLDVASGLGGFPFALAAHLEPSAVQVIASDARPEYAREGERLARERGYQNLAFLTADGRRLGEAAVGKNIDVVTCTQALHHMGAGGTALLLAEALQLARRGLVFVDLTRSVSGFLAFSALGWIGGRDGTFRHDAMLSMRKSFVPEELALIARCVPEGESLEAFHVAPGFSVLRTRVA